MLHIARERNDRNTYMYAAAFVNVVNDNDNIINNNNNVKTINY